MSPKRLSTILETVLVDALGLPAAATQVRLLRSWEEIVGPYLGRKTSPGKIRNGVLTVHVPSHAWAQELQLSTPVLLEKIRAVADREKVREIRFAVGPGTGSVPLRGVGEPPAHSGNDRREEVPFPDPCGLEEISDPETREILRSICRKSLRKGR